MSTILPSNIEVSNVTESCGVGYEESPYTCKFTFRLFCLIFFHEISALSVLHNDINKKLHYLMSLELKFRFRAYYEFN
jgi:hypothetical protein